LDQDTLRSSRSLADGRWRAIEVVAETGSTNVDLLSAAQTGEAGGLVLVAEYQNGGRGRMDRGWASPPGAGLTFSALVDCDEIPAGRWAWLPLLTGLAVHDAVRAVTGLNAVLKWPNDLLIAPSGRKVCGVLVQAAPGGEQAVIGIGLNVTTTEAELPVDTATSLLIEGARSVDRVQLLDAVLMDLADRLDAWRGAEGDAVQAGLFDDYLAACATLGQQVRVHEMVGAQWTGTASSIDADGRLIVRATDDEVRAVSAADVVHLRLA